MGLNPVEFWNMTPREFGQVYEGYKIRLKQTDRWVGRVCMVIANCNRSKSSRPFTEDDFVPKDREEIITEQNVNLMAKSAKRLVKIMGGKVWK